MNGLVIELVVTEECNLGCTYCYMDNKPVYMTRETLWDLHRNMDVFLKLYRKDTYEVSFFGGEPTLNWDLIEYAVPLFAQDPRCDHQIIISNGLLLTEEKISWLHQNHCGISMSFDGLWNNINRPLKNGTGSLDVYLKKRDLFHRMGIRGSKTMVGPASVSTMLENFKFLVDEYGFPTPDFTLVRDDIWSWDDVESFKENLTPLTDEIISRFEQGNPNTVGFFHLMLLDIFLATRLGKRSMGCFSGCGGIGVLPDGVVYPCARYGSEKKYPIFDLKTGTLYEKNIATVSAPSVCNPIAYSGCVGCDIRLYCNGGCNKSFFAKGDYIKAEPIPQLCALYKTIVSETLRIHKTLKNNPTYKTYIKQSVTPYLTGANNG